MTFSTFKRKEWAKTPRDERPIAPIPGVQRGTYAPVSTALPAVVARVKSSKTAPGRGPSAITQSAKGEECQVRLPGVCKYLPEYTIWSHARWQDAGRGKSIKAPDVCGCFACTACDACFDGQSPPPRGMTRDDVDHAWLRAHMRSLLILAKKGLV